MEQYSKIINKVSIRNIKFTIPMQNWAVSLCVKEMFDKTYLNKIEIIFSLMNFIKDVWK